MLNILLLPCEEVVQRSHLVALHHQPVNEMTAHETRTAGHQDFHSRRVRQMWCLHDKWCRGGRY